MFRFICFFVFALTFQYAWGAPIAMMMGCGRKGKQLSPEKQDFCCQHFNLDCSAGAAVKADSVLANGAEIGGNGDMAEIKVHIRTLGYKCKPPLYVCGVGLVCKKGLCFRNRTRAHLQQLMSRGQEVEEEEKHQTRDGDDVEDADPLPVRKGLILEGQSLKLADGETKSSLLSQMQATGSTRNEKKDPNALDLEEDELAANIGDLLSRQMGIKLNAKQVHKVREVIAGTFDERAEREEQVDDSEGSSVFDSNDTDTADVRSSDMTAPSYRNRGRERTITSDYTLVSSASLLGSELRQLRKGCGSQLNPDGPHGGMQCPAEHQKRQHKNTDVFTERAV